MNVIIFVILGIAAAQDFTAEKFQHIFGSKKCIPGSIANINLLEDNTLMLKDAKSTYQKLLSNVTQMGNQKQTEKPILAKLNEFAQFNNLDYYFKLEKEEGPSHEKIFTVVLIIGEERYTGQGNSLKKAKQQAAAVLFENTNYVIPVPVSDKSENIDDSLTPTVLLNNVCTELGIKVEYSVVDKEHDILRSNLIVKEKSKKSYLQRLNDSLYSNKSIHLKKDLPNMKGPFIVKLEVGDDIFFGSGHSIQAARHDAASRAIDFLLENKDSYGECTKEGSEEECKNKRNSLKSPISLAYEAAQLRGLYLECEVIDESGPAHKKTFVTQCQIGDIITTGEGKSKKESKKEAAVEILKRIDELPSVSKEKQVQSLMNSKKKKKKKKKKLIKSTFEEIGMLAEKTISSALGFGNNQDDKGSKTIDDQSAKKKHKKSSKPKYQNRSFQNEILKLSGMLDFDVSYSDFKETDKHTSLLSLHINPEHLCLGQGISELEARNKAAAGALDMIYKLDFKNHFAEKFLTIESEIKTSIYNALREDISEKTP